MNIEKATQLKIGDRVTYPPDRGEDGGTGVVTHVSIDPQKNMRGRQYVWVTVRYEHEKRSAVWPRLIGCLDRIFL